MGSGSNVAKYNRRKMGAGAYPSRYVCVTGTKRKRGITYVDPPPPFERSPPRREGAIWIRMT